MREADVCTTGSGPTTCSRSPRCSTTFGAIGISCAAAGERSKIQAPRPILLRRLGESSACDFRVRQHHLGDRDRDVEEFLVLDLFPARSDQVDDDLPRAGDRDHVSGLEHQTRLRFGDTVPPAEPVDEQPVLGCAVPRRPQRSLPPKGLPRAIGRRAARTFARPRPSPCHESFPKLLRALMPPLSDQSSKALARRLLETVSHQRTRRCM